MEHLSPRQKDYRGRLQRGQCSQCGAVAVASLAYCSRCLEKHRERTAENYHRRAALGVCVDCEKPGDHGSPRCDDCRADVAARCRDFRRRKRLRKMDERAAEGTW